MALFEEIRRDLERGTVQMIREYHGILFKEAMELSGNASDAEDLVFTAFENAVENIDRYDEGKGNLLSWLKGILRNQYTHFSRRKMQKLTMTMPEGDLVDSCQEHDISTEAEILANSDADLLHKAIDELPDDMREVIILRYMSDMPILKIARFLKITPGSVKMRLTRARRLLFGKLRDKVKGPKIVLGLLVLGGALLSLAMVVKELVEKADSVVDAVEENVASAVVRPVSPADADSMKRRFEKALYGEFENENENDYKEVTMSLKMPIMASAMTIVLAANAEQTAVGGYSTAHYVQEGLVLCYDGIENVGVGQHDDNPMVWVNLGSSGSDYNLTLPTWVSSQDGNSFLSKGSTANVATKFAAVTGIASGKATTIESVASAKWTAADNYNITQPIVATPRGAVGYRARDVQTNHGFYFNQIHSDGNVWVHDWFLSEKYIEDLHTFSLRTPVWAKSVRPFADGVQTGSPDDGNYNLGAVSAYSFFGNNRTDIRICSIRVYNRELTDAEVARNAKVDRIRFKGEKAVFEVADIPPQSRDFHVPTRPRPTVTDGVSGLTLVDGIDYDVAYSGNLGTGTAAVTVTGKGVYAGCVVVRKFEILGEVQASIKVGASGKAVADFTFSASDEPRQLFVVYGTSDAGVLTNNWGRLAALSTVPPGETSLTGVPLSGEIGSQYPVLRFFLETTADERQDSGVVDYVQDGLVLCYDGIENSGVGQHDDNPTVWVNLGSAGTDYNLTLPAWVTPQDGNSFLSKGSKSNTRVTFTSVVGLVAGEATTIEGMASAKWMATDDYGNTQTFVSTLRGDLGYRARGGSNVNHGFYFGQVHSDGNVWAHDWWISDRYIEDLHTLSLRTVAWGSSTLPFVDGVHAGSADGGNYNLGTRPYSFGSFGNTRSDIRICSIRVYNRELTDAEIARNAEVDARRYKDMPKASSVYVWRRPLEAKVRHVGGAKVSLKYGVDDVVRAAYVVWGNADGGESLAGWPNVAYLGTIPAGTTETNGLKLPPEADQARCGRFFIRYGSVSSVQTGLALCYDGVENAGRGMHDAQPTVWRNLGSAGSACDVTLPSWVAVTADGQALLSKGSTKNEGYPTFETVDGIEDGKVTTLEVVASGKWTAYDTPANLQTVFQTPRGGLGYRSQNTISPHYFYQSLIHSDGNVLAHYWIVPTADIGDIHTLSSRTAVDFPSPFLDGENVGTVDVQGGNLGKLTNYKLFANTRSDICIYAIRLYDHALTDAEIARNAQVDRVRFCGEASHGAECCSQSMSFARAGMCVIVR